jgi:uncharacterized protein (DUF1501 family)
MKNLKRRDFIKNASLGAFFPLFFEKQSLFGSGNVTQKLMTNDNVLVVIQLSGGNDGLNTVIPVNQYDKYLAARTNIAIKEDKLLKVPQAEGIGLNPGLAEFSKMMAEGKASIVQDVGYPNPNFSHFRATDIWNTASNSNEIIDSGWGGRFLGLDHPNFPEGYPNNKFPDPLAIQIGSVVTTALQGPIYNMGLSISDTTNFYKLISNETETVPTTLAGKELSYIREMSKQTNKYGDAIKNAALKVATQKEYPNQSLAAQLKIVARLIAGGLKTKIYYVRLGGFDTHSAQTDATDTSIGTHTNLMINLSSSIKAFQDDLKFLGVANKVLGMTYSEFGRRIKSNGSAGTDHGAAAPMFFFGEKVNAKYFGNPTILPAVAKNEDNITMQYDFRSIYASVLQNWFCVESSELKDVLLQNFQPLLLVNPEVCGFITSKEPEISASRLMLYPNPIVDNATIKFKSEGGHCMVQVFNMRGSEVLSPIDNNYSEGSHEIPVSLYNLPQGTYMVRFQNNAYQEIKKVVKV